MSYKYKLMLEIDPIDNDKNNIKLLMIMFKYHNNGKLCEFNTEFAIEVA